MRVSSKDAKPKGLWFPYRPMTVATMGESGWVAPFITSCTAIPISHRPSIEPLHHLLTWTLLNQVLSKPRTPSHPGVRIVSLAAGTYC